MKRKGQSTLEYAILIAIIVAALLAMQIYIKRGIQGKLRSSADSIGEQYSAGNMTSKYTTEQVGEMKTNETFGLTDAGTGRAKGVSRYNVTQAAEIDRTATGADAEKVTQTLSNETLVP